MRIYPTSASFLISEDCNLACKYCFELNNRCSDKMTKEIAIDSVKYLYKNAVKNLKVDNNANVFVTLFGGEPMLNFEMIENVIETGVNLQNNTNIPFSVNMVTNGTILTDYMVKKLRWYVSKGVDLVIQLSVDAIKEYNDINRVTRSGDGSFNLVEKNINKFKEIYGGKDYYKTSMRRNLHVHGSLNDITIDKMYESYRYFIDVWKIPYIWFMPIHGDFWTNENAEAYKNNLVKIAKHIKSKIIEENTLDYLKDYAPLNLALNDKRNNPITPCGAGQGYVSITASGDIYPCHQFYFNEAKPYTLIGNIYGDIDFDRLNIFSNYDAKDLNCYIDRKCENYNCYRCIAENYEHNGSILLCSFDARCKMSSYETIIVDELRKFVNKKFGGEV